MLHIDIKKELYSRSENFILDLNLYIGSGNFAFIYGSSGAGKSSLLNMISGVMSPDEGKITFNGVTWFDSIKKIDQPISGRSIGYVLQNPTLFHHMTARQNLQFAVNKEGDLSHMNELVQLIELGHLLDEKPKYLSGGQNQRVAIAQTLIRNPKILLLDEPFNGLDSKVIERMKEYLIKLKNEMRLTILMISHHLSDGISLADRFIELENGRVLQDTEFSKDQIDNLPSTQDIGKILSSTEKYYLVQWNDQLIKVKREIQDSKEK